MPWAWGSAAEVFLAPARRRVGPVVPPKVPVAGHVVKAGWFRYEQDEHELLLLSYRVGRWNLLVVPPRTPPAVATWLMAAAGDPRRTASASSLVADAGRLTVTAEADRPGEAVGESEGGPEPVPWSFARGAARSPRRRRNGRRGTDDGGHPGDGDRAAGGDRGSAFLIRRLNAQHGDRSAAFHHGRGGVVAPDRKTDEGRVSCPGAAVGYACPRPA
ncbi:DUF5994 family protein [Streptomyces sp. NPDC047853]|uniref:DUF5994 family protein n=1 Tax=unclassified Streptomyces TaxID=2593676 RepID=UPI0034557576